MDFKLPDIGEGVHEGEITKWLVKAGDPITADQPMVEIMTDKATVEIPSPVTGTVDKVFAKEGETVPVGTVIVTLSEGGGAKKESPKNAEVPRAASHAGNDEARKAPSPASSFPASATAARGETPREMKTVEPATDDVIPFDILATPATRKLARDLKVDLKSVKGTGTNGRITKVDVQMAYEGQQAGTQRSSHPVSTSTAVAAPKAQVPSVQRGAINVIPLKGMRKRISEAMTHSKHTAAHFTYVEEVDMSEIVKLRKNSLAEADKRGIKLSFLPFIIKGLIPALKEFPYLNASLDDEKQEIILKGDYNIGIATDTPQGLIVPVIKNADSKSIWEIAKDISELSERARAGKSQLEDLKGGTFTVTNAGSIGGVLATPIINHPEVAILGVNAIRKRPIVRNDEIVVGDVMFLSMSVDHRVVDGADAARFMNRLVYFLTDPSRLVFA